MKNIYKIQWHGISLKQIFSLCLSIITILAINSIQIPAVFAADTTNIIGNWHLDEGRGKVAQDSSGNFNAGNLKADTGGTAPTWIARKFDTAALQIARQGSVEIPDSPILEPANITLEAWVKRASGAANSEYVISKGADVCRFASYAFYTGSSKGLIFYISDGKVTYVESPDAGANIWDDKWHHIAGTYDRQTVRLYVDGKQIGNGSPATFAIGYGLPTNDKFYIGGYGTGCVPKFRGDIDEVRVWNQSLTNSEINARAMLTNQ